MTDPVEGQPRTKSAGSSETRTQPVLWTGDFVCTCGHRMRVEVLGRKGHQYDELQGGDEDQPYIKESYEAEARGVLALYRCPKCGTRPGIGGELRRLGMWLVTLTIMIGLAALLFWWLGNPAAMLAMGLGFGFAVVARTYTFISAVIEANDRVRPVQEAARSNETSSEKP